MADRSNITIPGVNSSFKTDKMIEDLMKLERIPLEKKQKKIESIQTEKKSWLKVNNRLSRLEDSSKKLYGHENPFNQKKGISSSSDAVAVSTNRDAEIQSFDIKIKQIAKADKLKTPTLPTDYQVPKGKYTFAVGDKKISFYYKGGTLSDFSATLNKKGKDFLHSSVVKATSKSQVLVIESLKTGRSNQLQFLDDAKKLALETGMILDRPQTNEAQMLAQNLMLESGAKEVVDYPPPANQKGKLVISYHFESQQLEEKEGKKGLSTSSEKGNPPIATNTEGIATSSEIQTTTDESDETVQPESGKNPHFNKAGEAIIPISGSVTVEDVTVFQAPSLVEGILGKGKLGNQAQTEGADKTEGSEEASQRDGLSKLTSFERDQLKLRDTASNEIIVFNRLSGSETISNLPISDEMQKLTFPVADYLDLQNIAFQNPFETKRLVIDSIAIDDGNSRDYTPLNPLQLAQDSIVEMDGLEITRPSNKIDDLVYGVTLDLKKPSDEEITINIEHDIESIKNTIFEWVFNYNKSLETISILTSSDEKVLEELTYLNEAEKEELKQELGTMKGNNTLNGLKSRLQTLTSGVYKSNAHTPISVLNDIGIGTNVVGGGGFNLSKLRGYLEIDEKKLDQKIAENPQAIKDFFATDTNEDFVADNGLAFSVGNFLRTYTATGGVIFTKTGSMDQQIKRLEKEVDTLEAKLISKEKEYKVKYGRMEGMINELQKKSSSLDGLNRKKE